jgi:hypothetical protein
MDTGAPPHLSRRTRASGRLWREEQCTVIVMREQRIHLKRAFTGRPAARLGAHWAGHASSWRSWPLSGSGGRVPQRARLAGRDPLLMVSTHFLRLTPACMWSRDERRRGPCRAYHESRKAHVNALCASMLFWAACHAQLQVIRSGTCPHTGRCPHLYVGVQVCRCLLVYVCMCVCMYERFVGRGVMAWA